MLRALIYLCFASSFLVSKARAHDTWLIADQMRVAPKTAVTLDLTSGVELPKLDVAPRPENAGRFVAARREIVPISDKSAAPRY